MDFQYEENRIIMKAKEITWSYYIYNEDHKASENDIINIENKIGIIFPKDYLDIVKNYQGMTINNVSIKFNGQTEGIGALFTFDDFKDNKKYSYSLINCYNNSVKSDIPKEIIPFTDAGGSNSTFCFDYRESKTNPKIIFIDSVMNLMTKMRFLY